MARSGTESARFERRLRFGAIVAAALGIAIFACSERLPKALVDDGADASVADAGGADADADTSDADADASLDAGPPPLVACENGPPAGLPTASPRILIVAPSSAAPQMLVQDLQGLLAADASFVAPEVVLQLTDATVDYSSRSLVGFWYSPGGRDARIAPLAGPFTWVVLLDDAIVAYYYPELHFEGVRVVACRARAAGATPILLQTWTNDPSEADVRGVVAYRVGNGTGTPVVPAGYAWQGAQTNNDAGAGDGGPATPAQGPSAVAAFVAAASLYSAITGKSAETTTFQPSAVTGVPALAAAAKSALDAHATTTHYTTPFASAVQLRTLAPEPTLHFATAGTSSEALWTDRMNELAPKLGMTPLGVALGGCNATKTFDATCLDGALATFTAAQYRILFARSYAVSSATTIATGKQDDLQVQVWDRHYDSDPADGAATVAALEAASSQAISNARGFDLAWIPHHLAYAKLRTARPNVAITSDGTHATYPVSYALATMSLVSRTSRWPSTAGLDDDTVAGAVFANETIRQLATLSQRGVFVPDDPTTRPKVR